MDKKAQSALEYLMTYGWALIVIAVVIGVLVYIMGTSTGGTSCSSNNNEIVVSDSALNANGESFSVVLQNATGTSINPYATANAILEDLNVTAGGGTDDDFATYLTGWSSGAQKTLTLYSRDSGTAIAGNWRTELNIGYTSHGGLDKNATVVCSGTA